LKQFNSTAEQQSHQQEPDQSEAIADSKHPGDKPKCCKVLKDLPDSGDRALVGRDDRQHKYCGDAEARQRARNSSILVHRPFHNLAASREQCPFIESMGRMRSLTSAFEPPTTPG
jgi:hypothetical protein